MPMVGPDLGQKQALSEEPGDAPVWRAPGNVTIERRPAQATGIALPRPVPPQAQARPQPSFVPAPPATARRHVRRMPNVEELPLVAQNEIKAHAGQGPTLGLAEQKKKVGFLERLTGVGRGRKDEEVPMTLKQEPEFGQSRSLAASVQTEAAVPAPRGLKIERPRGEPGMGAVPKRIEAQPRVASMESLVPRGESPDDDDLEIPAFLRRRAT
ncbi:MAG: hypothetical protein WED13_10375, partial [Methyloceanibacter sp.]